MLTLIMVTDSKGAMGLKGRRPWVGVPQEILRPSDDFFEATTRGHPCLIGRVCYDWERVQRNDQLPLLEGCETFVVGQQPTANLSSSDRRIQNTSDIQERFNTREAFVIGGLSLATSLLPKIDRVLWTILNLRCSDFDRKWPFNPVGGMWDQGFELTNRILHSAYVGTAEFRRIKR